MVEFVFRGAGVYDAVSRISHGYAVNSDVGASYSSGRKQDRRKDFEKRFQIVEELRKMGGRITVTGRQAVVCGGRKLTGTTVCARELRGGAALVVAGLSAQGESVVKHAEYIERGYERPDQLFGQLGAVIRIREQVEE